jgi:hypothetical protein
MTSRVSPGIASTMDFFLRMRLLKSVDFPTF